MKKYEIINPDCLIRYFPDKNNDKDSIGYPCTITDDENKTWIHPITNKTYNLKTVAHQLRGIDVYFIVRGYTNSIPMIINEKNNRLVLRGNTPSDYYNKLYSPLLRRILKQAQEREKGIIFTIIGLEIIVILTVLIPFLPFLILL